MKISKTLGIVLVILGELLLLTGIMISYLQWPNIFQGLFAGPALIVVGFAIEIPAIIQLDAIITDQAAQERA